MTTVGASGHHRLRSWAVAIVVLLSTLLNGLPPTSMEWPGSQALCADVAVTVAVNPDHTPTTDLLDYRITAGHSHGPPVAINGPAANGHTYYVLAGDTPVLVHNCGGGPSGRLLSTQASGSGPQLPRTMACVCEIAKKYRIDISGLNIKINLGGRGYRGMTEPNQRILLTPRAFDNEEQLARTLVHERFHVGQIRAAGGGYPQTPAQFEAWETAAYAHEDEWWATVGSLVQ